MTNIASKANDASWLASPLKLAQFIIAVFALLVATLPTAAMAAAPGTVTLNTPANGDQLANSDALEFSWAEETQSATWYYIWVNRNGTKYRDQWVGGNNVWNPSETFAGGDYTWWVRPWNSSGYGPWSSGGSFSIAVNAPGQVALVSPLGTSEVNFTLPYVWQEDANASWYELYISRNNAYFLDQWYSTSQLNPAGGQLSIQVPNHRTGNYRWWVRGWGMDGMGPWSSAGNFEIDLTPGVATLLTPEEGSSTDNFFPILSWSEPQPAASWYQVAISYAASTYAKAFYFTTWTSTNFWQPNTALVAGDYTWWVRGWNSEGLGAWSSAGHFTVPPIQPSVTQQLFPGGAAYAGSTLNYRWNNDPFTEWYNLYVLKDGQVFLDRWLATDNLTYFGPNMYGFPAGGHGSGNYQWRIRGWNRYGMGQWSDYYSFTVPTVTSTLAIGGSQWVGVMSVYVSQSNATKYHVVTGLNFNNDGTFNESGIYERLNHNPYNDDFFDESYSGTYSVSGATINGRSGDGKVTFSLTLNANRSQVVSGTWTDAWDGNQAFQIFPSDLVRTQ